MIMPKNLFLVFSSLTDSQSQLLSIFLNSDSQTPSEFHHLNPILMTLTPGLKTFLKLIKNNLLILMKSKLATILNTKLQQYSLKNAKNTYPLNMKSQTPPFSKIALFKLPKKPSTIFTLAKIKIAQFCPRILNTTYLIYQISFSTNPSKHSQYHPKKK